MESNLNKMSSKLAHNLSSKIRTEDVLLPVGNNSDFKSMLLRPLILDGLTKAGFIQPSPIQLKAIPLARCGLDLIVQSKSGTGKTCVFTVAALELLNIDSLRLQALVVAPTREIALQIEYVIKEIGSQFSGLKVVPLIGGLPLQKDKERLKEGCHIVVGTPGRLLHCIELGLIELSAVRLFVLDEADMLMNLSFKDDINAIFKSLPASKQVVVCSATFTSELKSFLGKYMNNAPTYVTPSGKCPVLLGLRHFVLLSPDQSSNQLRRLINKENQLMSILKSVPFSQCLVFSNYQTRAESICCKLRRKGWEKCCEWIAGNQDQGTRIGVYERVRDMKARILLTTDLTARGLDFEATNLVVNLDLPADSHTYLHRMGRAGRFGSQGIVITLLALDEMAKFRTLIGKIGSYANACIIPDNVLNKELWTLNLDVLEVLEGHSGSEEPEPEEIPKPESEDVAEIKTDSECVHMIYSSNEEEEGRT
ncbi:probable ATP-dependent RNA helicase DDX20 isoform X1 [Nilaparvata lugens]|uniref:probable ATP-dependent RNA helicase DDX20 isoform X1 n=2 Tax=Nilaparvata lugens TaxID=108931 RepID=UPI00193EB4A8|nr:probable ATP-dependent RNA helicase DDX20 isoform X1 [Nilaparvata lugens]